MQLGKAGSTRLRDHMGKQKHKDAEALLLAGKKRKSPFDQPVATEVLIYCVFAGLVN
jgi:hypothetical protein